jgi:predicted HTH domain antitoxin
MNVNVTVTLPDEIIEADSDSVSRDVFEQVVAEAYKNGRLSLKQVRILLGFSSRFEAEDFIQRHRASGYTIHDLKREMKTMGDLGLV